VEIIIQQTKQAAADVAARIIAGLLREKPDAALGLATGSTPLPLYEPVLERGSRKGAKEEYFNRKPRKQQA